MGRNVDLLTWGAGRGWQSLGNNTLLSGRREHLKGKIRQHFSPAADKRRIYGSITSLEPVNKIVIGAAKRS